MIAGTMVMAIVKVHGPNGLWATENGYEYNLILIAVTIGVALTGTRSICSRCFFILKDLELSES